MAMTSDVRSAYRADAGELLAHRARVKKVVFSATATAGSVILRDGGASGTVVFEIHTPAIAGFHTMEIPANGLLFTESVYADLTNVTDVTVLYA